MERNITDILVTSEVTTCDIGVGICALFHVTRPSQIGEGMWMCQAAALWPGHLSASPWGGTRHVKLRDHRDTTSDTTRNHEAEMSHGRTPKTGRSASKSWVSTFQTGSSNNTLRVDVLDPKDACGYSETFMFGEKVWKFGQVSW